MTYVATFDRIEFIPAHYVLADDDDFIREEDGEFSYVGDADYVIIPEKINEVTITIANGYLFQERRDILGVAFQSPKNITSMEDLFFGSEATSLDLSGFDTSNVTNMSFMFVGSQATSLDLSSFDTSNVNDMDGMFKDSLVTSGYARNETEAAKFNDLIGTAVFVVKPQA